MMKDRDYGKELECPNTSLCIETGDYRGKCFCINENSSSCDTAKLIALGKSKNLGDTLK